MLDSVIGIYYADEAHLLILCKTCSAVSNDFFPPDPASSENSAEKETPGFKVLGKF